MIYIITRKRNGSANKGEIESRMLVEGKDESRMLVEERERRKESGRTWLLFGNIRDVGFVKPPRPSNFFVSLGLCDDMLSVEVV
jgi:hypothetical protein